MKFLLSGSLFQKQGPRSLLLKCLLLIIVGLSLHAGNYSLNLIERCSLEQEKSALQEGPDQPPDNNLPSSEQFVPEEVAGQDFNAGLYENLHIDLFLFSIIYLLLASVWLQAPEQDVLKKLYVHAPALLLLLFIAVRLLSYQMAIGLYLELLAASLFYLIYFSNAIILLWLLLRPSTSRSGGPAA